MLRRISTILTLLLVLILFSLSFLPTGQGRAQAGTAYDMIAAVNALRAGYGLGPLEIDPILMSIAQAHADYMASTETISHTGAGGTSARDRAAAAGFGNGASFFVSENIAGGTNLSVQSAIYDYWQDSLHLNTMIGEYSRIGAGVGFSGDKVYYTIDVGHYTGAELPEDVEAETPVPGATQAPPPTTQPTSIGYGPFIISTPRGDGAVIHNVGYGQTLIGIAETYDISLTDLLERNFLTVDSVIYEGDILVIVPSDEPGGETAVTVTGTVQVTTSSEISGTLPITGTEATTGTLDNSATDPPATGTPTPTRTPSPSPTHTQPPETTATTEPTAVTTEQSAAIVSPDILRNDRLLTYTAIGLAFIVLVAVLISGFTNSNTDFTPPRDPEDEET